MEFRTIKAEGAPKAVGPYSHSAVAGDLVFCSGQVPLDPATGELVAGDIAAQTERILDNLAAVLTASNSSLDRILKTTVFLADIGDFTAMNEAYAKRFGDHRPARSTVGVAGLPRGARIEIECIAARR
jgi:2-iminobutanoate/2-iminopropanoate deaminase